MARSASSRIPATWPRAASSRRTSATQTAARRRVRKRALASSGSPTVAREKRAVELDRPVEIRQRDELVGRMRLGDVAGADYDRVEAVLLVQRGFGPEVERADAIDKG